MTRRRRTWRRHLGRNLEHEFRMLDGEDAIAAGRRARRRGKGEDGEDTVERAMRRAILRTESEYGMSNAQGCFFCHGRAPEGGSTVNVVAIQRVASGRGDDALAFDAVTANVGDSAALMLPHPSEFGSISAEDRDKHVRLSRDHNPVDPFEARRLIQTECRLARLRGNAGEELGPLARVSRWLRRFESLRGLRLRGAHLRTRVHARAHPSRWMPTVRSPRTGFFPL